MSKNDKKKKKREKQLGFVVPAGEKNFSLDDYDPSDTNGLTDVDDAKADLEREKIELARLQHLLYADARYALLIVLQGMDASGKDGTIRHVMEGMNPLGVTVTAFKAPSVEERAHDFLWRIHSRCPRKGEVGIFNRSQYEDVLVPRVHGELDKAGVKNRCAAINDFERHLSDQGTRVVKFFLHISKDEQRERLEERLVDPDKQWKFDPSDLEARRQWDAYRATYDETIRRTSTDHAPWIVVPANKKWFRNLVVAEHIVRVLGELDLRFPKAKVDLGKMRID